MSISVKSLLVVGIGILWLTLGVGQGKANPVAQTESICNLGMVKNDPPKTCLIPIPRDCTVANFPGYDEPWADVSKAGGTTCQFNEQETDWKTKITGTCQTCTTDQCSGRFSVMLNCAQNIPRANPNSPNP